MTCLRRRWLARLIVRVVLLAFLPMTSVMARCELACTFEAVQQMPGHSSHPGHAGHLHKASTNALGHDAMQHAGACHLASIPALATDEPGRAAIPVTPDWTPDSGPTPRSLVWPPPKHPPRS